MSLVCRTCGREWPTREVPFSAECEACGTELHACVQCDFHEPGLHNDCRETIAEPVREVERANRCELFRPAAGPPRAKGKDAPDRASEAKKKLEDLFRK